MKDYETGRRLYLTVGLVVLMGAVSLTWALTNLAMSVSLVYPLVFAGLTAVAMFCQVRHRVRSQHSITPTGAAVLAAVALLPAPWAIVAVTCGAGIVAVLRGQQPIKGTFNTAKEAVAGAVAAATFVAVGGTVILPDGEVNSWASLLLALGCAAVAYAVADKLPVTLVVSMASRVPWRIVVRRNLDVDSLGRVLDIGIAAGTVALYAVDPLLLGATPLGIAVAYLINRHRLYMREERMAWQRLSEATDELTRVGVDKVVETAVGGAASLFPGLEIEVEHHRDGRARLVRAEQDAVTYDGDLAGAPARSGHEREYPLLLDEESGEGFLRLRFNVQARLSDREQHMLTTFVAGLSTAIRNAAAYEQASRLAEQNSFDATHDSLTGLPNRRQLRERTEEALRWPRRGIIALALLDLNHFKEVNDTLGHSAGDRVLVEVADRLRTSAGNGFVARLGGDEFAVLYTNLGAPAMAAHRARDLLASLREPMDLDGVLINLETSAGLAVAGDHTDPDELLRRADVAMYQAKGSSRQVAIYAHASDSADLSRLALAGELPRAVEGQEFTVGFQPVVDLATGRVVAAEALARWQHPDLGHLPPATFLGLVERSGLLAPFTEAVLARALEAAATWHDAGFPLQVAVNVSPRSLADPKLPTTVLSAVSRAGVRPQQLVLELTETTAIGHLDTVTNVITALREAGVAVALDDFGTGQSSMAAVLQVPVDQLKIDRSWVSRLEDSSEARGLICATVELARQLDVAVIAEGVERPAQRETLWELGCTAGQGSLFGWPPQPGEKFLRLLERGYDGTPGTLAAQLHPEATVVRLPRQPARTART